MATSMATYTDRIDLVHWIPITTSLGQAVFAPLFSNCSDLFGHTKLWIGIPLCFSVIGSIVTGTASTYVHKIFKHFKFADLDKPFLFSFSFAFLVWVEFLEDKHLLPLD